MDKENRNYGKQKPVMEMFVKLMYITVMPYRKDLLCHGDCGTLIWRTPNTKGFCKPCWSSKFLKGRKLSDETKSKLSKAAQKRFEDPDERIKQSINQKMRFKINPHPRGMLGKKHSAATIELYKKTRKGELNAQWKGGLTKIGRAIRQSNDYKIWRQAVLDKDGRMCVICGSTENLHVDHIKSFAKHPELRLEITNGRVLCATCHRKTDNYGWKAR